MILDAALEAALLTARHEDASWLVCGDWLAERGDEVSSHAFYVLGGRATDTPRTRQTLALAISTGVWLAEEQLARKDAELPEEAPVFVSTLAQFVRGGPVTWPNPSTSRRFDASRRALDALERGSFADAARLARTCGEPERWLRLFRYALSTPTPFEAPPGLVEVMNGSDEVSEAAFALGPSSNFSFQHVVMTNTTVGLEGRRLSPRPPPRAGFLAIAMRLGGELTRERLDTAIVFDVFEEATGWVPRTPFECLHELYSLVAGNEGHGVAVDSGEERPLLDLLEELGPCLGGANTSSDFPYMLMQFEQGLVVFHFIY